MKTQIKLLTLEAALDAVIGDFKARVENIIEQLEVIEDEDIELETEEHLEFLSNRLFYIFGTLPRTTEEIMKK